jgi:HK97 gp10 family phage protein
VSDTNFTGLRELQEMLNTLPVKIERNIMRSAMRAGAKVLQQEIKANIPVLSGLTKAGIKISTGSRKGVITAKVKATGKHGYIANFLEWGTAAHVITSKSGTVLAFGGAIYRTVDHPGIRPHPVFRPALDTKNAAAVIAVGEMVKKRLTAQGINAADIEVDE